MRKAIERATDSRCCRQGRMARWFTRVVLFAEDTPQPSL